MGDLAGGEQASVDGSQAEARARRADGGFVVGDGAKIGSNAVVIKPVPAGATAVGIPARIVATTK